MSETLDTGFGNMYCYTMSKDSMREYLQTSVEAYDLAGTPAAASIYKETVDEVEPLDAPVMWVTGRQAQLDLGIDIKKIFDSFIGNIKRQYGPARAERFITWVKVGYIEQFHSDHRREIKWDRKRLQGLIFKYRHTWA